MNIDVAAYVISDRGAVRSQNQDNFCIDGTAGEQNISSIKNAAIGAVTKNASSAFGVFDGMGGEKCGDEASAAAASAFLEFFGRGFSGCDRKRLEAFYDEAHKKVRRIQDRVNGISGSTAAVLVIADGAAWISNLGDSKVFIIRDSAITQLSEDHTLTELMIRTGALTRENAAKSAGKGRLLRFIGAPPEECDTTPFIMGPFALEKGDRFVLCSDGVTDGLSDEAILSTAGDRKADCESAAAQLTRMAIAGGSRDNCTALVVEIKEIKKPKVRASSLEDCRRAAGTTYTFGAAAAESEQPKNKTLSVAVAVLAVLAAVAVAVVVMLMLNRQGCDERQISQTDIVSTADRGKTSDSDAARIDGQSDPYGEINEDEVSGTDGSRPAASYDDKKDDGADAEGSSDLEDTPTDSNSGAPSEPEKK